MAGLPLAVGQAIELNDGRHAVIRFLGATAFAPGEWVGVELDDPSGKNDGSIKGDRYFDCETNHGMFLRPTGVGQILEQPKSQPKPAARTVSTGPAAAKGRPSSLVKGANLETKRRESTISNGGIKSPIKSPTKQLGSNTTASRMATPPSAATRRLTSTTAAPKPRTSLAATSSLAGRRTSTVPPATSSAATRTGTRPALTGHSTTSRIFARDAPVRPSLATPRVSSNSSRLSSVPSDVSEDQDNRGRGLPVSSPPSQDTPSPRASTPTQETEDDEDQDLVHTTPRALPSATKPPPRRGSSPPGSTPQRTARNATVSQREVESLQAKMNLLERKRLEDRERLKKMTEIEQERDKYGAIVQKLQTKLQSQSQELAELKAQLKDSETRLIDIENIQAEHDAVVEMATLDREMAEETAEVLKTEVEALKVKNEEMELELDVLREENQELGREMNPEERTSQGWLQLERSNERLREALMRLRDITQEQEAELKDQISGLEEDVKDLATVKTDYKETKEKLLATEADLEDLRQQLDAAMGAEDMIEELTERNMTMQEQMDELRATIEDLENLKELNDELEVNHVEAEKQMQEEIDYLDSVVNEYQRRSGQQQQTIEDCEYTISRFRDLVTNLQADLEEMRASQQITETEAESLSNRSRAMMDLNMKLQISAAKTQVKTIDLELRRLEAEEASEHLAIVHLFLPEAFHNERDSILALLRFKRIGFKANLIHSFLKERVNGQGTSLADEHLFAACSVMDRLTWVVSMSERFVNSICSCSVEDFSKYEGALYELEPVERALNGYIESLKRGELKEGRVDEELQRSMAVMAHLASLHIKPSSATFTDEVLMQTSLIQSHLETAASSLSLCKSFVQSNVPTAEKQSEEVENGESADPSLLERLDDFITNIRGAKVIAGRTHRALTDLQSRGLALDSSTFDSFTTAEQAASVLASFGRNAGETLQALFGEEGREEAFTASEVNLVLSRLSASIFKLATPESSTMTAVASHLRSLADQLTEMGALPTDLENTVEFERTPAPWVKRSADLRATKLTSVDTEAEVARLNEIVRERSLLVRTKEQELEEQGVRIEMLEARMSEAQKRSLQVGDLETSLQDLKQREESLREQLTGVQADVKRIRQERDELRQQVAAQQAVTKDASRPNTAMGYGIGGGASRIELERAKTEARNLRQAIRHLQAQKTLSSSTTAAAAATTPAKDLDWLSEPLLPTPTPQQRQLSVLEAEAKSAFGELLTAVIDAKPVLLNTQTAKNKLAWRPASETTQWAARKRREEWEIWREWQDDLVRRAKSGGGDVRLDKIGNEEDEFLHGSDGTGIVVVGHA